MFNFFFNPTNTDRIPSNTEFKQIQIKEYYNMLCKQQAKLEVLIYPNYDNPLLNNKLAVETKIIKQNNILKYN